MREFHCPLPLSNVAVHDRSSIVHCPRAVWQCITTIPLFRQQPPPRQASPSPQLMGPRIARVPQPAAPGLCGSAPQELHCLLPPCNVALHCMSFTNHCRQAVRQCRAGVPLPVAPRRCGGALHSFDCPVPADSGAVRRTSTTAHGPRAVRQCIAGVPLPTAPMRCGNALHEFHRPLPPCSEAVYSKSCTAHCP